MKPSRFLKSSPPRFITTPGELPFQEGRPLLPSDDEDEGQADPSSLPMMKTRARWRGVPNASRPIEKFS
jgi:hypothetical protein